ncbi:TPA: DUF551 domain-containing protein [Enterobacter kobei]
MSTITSEFTKEQLQEIIETDHVQCGEASALARIALASLEAEPVAYIFKHPAGRLFWSLTDESNKGQSDVMPVYTAPPAPVSVPECFMRLLHHAYGMTMGHDWNKGTMAGHHREKLCRAVDECRAAMLHGADGTLANEGTIPANTPCKEAPEHIWLQTAGVWPENGEFSELTWCSDNLHEDDTLYVRADVVTGNSPVIPDGWVLVPVEPTPDMRDAYHQAQEEYEETGGLWSPDHQWKAMLSAAPQQEVK